MSETETTEAFLKEVSDLIRRNDRGKPTFELSMTPAQWQLMLSLARRGAAIPDQPTEDMIDDGCNCADDLMHCYQSDLINIGGFEKLHQEFRREITGVYCAMLSRALKEFSK
jgi:hypothetical protein